MEKQNRLVKASFYRKEGCMLWFMYGLFFFLGYYGGYTKKPLIEPLIIFIIMLIVILIFGKKENNPDTPSFPMENKKED